MTRLNTGRLRRRLQRIGIVAGAVAVTWLLAAFALDRYGRDRTPIGSYDAIIVAGARVRHGGAPSGSLLRRAQRAAELFGEHLAPRVVLTGGSIGDRPSEASIAASALRDAGVPDSAVLMEDRSSTTEENARFARELLGAKRVLVVTDTYHVLRARLTFERYFPDVRVIGVAYRPWPQLRHALREVAAVIAFGTRELFHVVSGERRAEHKN